MTRKEKISTPQELKYNRIQKLQCVALIEIKLIARISCKNLSHYTHFYFKKSSTSI